jgi:hypothetical protein
MVKLTTSHSHISMQKLTRTYASPCWHFLGKWRICVTQ